MLKLSPALAAACRPAADIDVRVLSYGMLRHVRADDGADWERSIGTLHDQRIFGTTHALACACGKYRGAMHRGMVCDRCGVKVASLEGRRTRYGHVELDCEIAHPCFAGNRLTVWPVLPAEFFTSPGGHQLAEAYDLLIAAVPTGELLPLRTGVWRICDLLLPAVEFAFAWRMTELGALARGLALELRTDAPDEAERCSACGHHFTGPATRFCPECGQQMHDE